jgi:hypothetical protein
MYNQECNAKLVQLRAMAILFVIVILLLLVATAQAQEQPKFQDYKSFVAWMRATHKAPFLADPSRMMSKEERAAFAKKLMESAAANAIKEKKVHKNVKVNQDRNPWPKFQVSQAVDPSDPANLVVISNDLREIAERAFYHVSTDHGRQFTDDAISPGGDDFLLGSDFLANNNAVTSFDAAGNEFVVQISGNSLFDEQFDYGNDDVALQLVMGESHGLFLDQIGTDLDIQQCSGPIGFGLPASCAGFLESPSVVTDTYPSSPAVGTTWITVTLFCEFMGDSNCPTIGGIDITPGNSGIIGVSFKNFAQNGWQGTGLVSGTHTNVQFSSVVVDASGTPHVFFDDFTDPNNTTMWESTFTSGAWVVGAKPVATFTLTGTSNPAYVFSIGPAAAPGCGIFQNTAYCAFSANQVAGGEAETTTSVYLAKVDVTTGASTITRVNNDTFGTAKDHLFAWAAAAQSGAVYVGWYDDRNDPNDVNMEYFVGKSTNGGTTFPAQMAVSDEPFNPCINTDNCGFFGATNQLVAGSDGVVHAAWSDTRDGVSLQLWSEAIKW